MPVTDFKIKEKYRYQAGFSSYLEYAFLFHILSIIAVVFISGNKSYMQTGNIFSIDFIKLLCIIRRRITQQTY